MRTIDLRGTRLSTAELLAAVPRADAARTSTVVAAAAGLVDEVRARGEAALREQSDRFDGVTGHHVRVPPGDIDDALSELDPAVRAALEEAIRRVRAASAAQVPATSTTELARGALVTQRWMPVVRAGVYVPAGKAVYPSSVVMNVVAAQVAGVRSVALASPPQSDGRVHPAILAAAGLLGVDEVYAMGGAGAIGALAYGVPAIGLDPVDVVTGPGNDYVAAAKRAVAGVVGIDSEAGATEILIVADASADARFVAADLISQAEHDEQAAAVLVTTSAELAARVAGEVAAAAASTRHRQRVKTALAGPQSAVVLVDDLSTAAAFSNAYAPEHLELHVRDATAAASDYVNAGAIFIGPDSPVSLGDYLAGSNHVLPTGGQARYASGLGAHTFLRPQQLISYDRIALAEVGERIVTLAEAEALPAHGAAVTARLED